MGIKEALKEAEQIQKERKVALGDLEKIDLFLKDIGKLTPNDIQREQEAKRDIELVDRAIIRAKAREK